jgi:hypothetical protein
LGWFRDASPLPVEQKSLTQPAPGGDLLSRGAHCLGWTCGRFSISLLAMK